MILHYCQTLDDRGQVDCVPATVRVRLLKVLRRHDSNDGRAKLSILGFKVGYPPTKAVDLRSECGILITQYAL